MVAPHAAQHVGRHFGENPYLRRLVLVYAVLWAAAAIAPWDRPTWLLENLLVFALVGLLAATHRRFVFSNLSYSLIVLFLLLHAVGSHYTYSTVPLGDWLARVLALERNPYDRFVHFAFGLLLFYPLRELTLRVMHVHRVWSFAIPVAAILSLSAGYEVLESWAARIVRPEVGIAFVGAQGDVWDGQKDMTAALAGALLALGAAEWHRRRTGHEAYLAASWRAARDR